MCLQDLCGFQGCGVLGFTVYSGPAVGAKGP